MRPLVKTMLTTRSLVPSSATRLLRAGTNLWIADGMTLQAIDRFSGQTRFQIPLTGETGLCVGQREGVVFACASNGEVVAVGADGKERWRVEVDEPLGDNLYVAGPCLLVSGRTGSLWCFAWKNGQLLWKDPVDLPAERPIAPVVEFAHSQERNSSRIWWLRHGVLSAGKLSGDGLEVLQRITVGNNRFLSAGAPQAGVGIYIPATVGKSRFISSVEDGYSGESLPGLLLPLDLWLDSTGKPLRREWGAIDPVRGLVHVGRRGLPAGIAPWEGKAPAAVLWDGTKPFMALYNNGKITVHDKAVNTLWLPGIATNILVAPSRKLYELDLYFVSSHGWLYSYTVPSAAAFD